MAVNVRGRTGRGESNLRERGRGVWTAPAVARE